MNITELARKLKITTEQLKDELPKLGFDIGRRAIKIDDAAADKVMKLWAEKKSSVPDNRYFVTEKKLNEVVPQAEKKCGFADGVRCASWLKFYICQLPM